MQQSVQNTDLWAWKESIIEWARDLQCDVFALCMGVGEKSNFSHLVVMFTQCDNLHDNLISKAGIHKRGLSQIHGLNFVHGLKWVHTLPLCLSIVGPLPMWWIMLIPGLL